MTIAAIAALFFVYQIWFSNFLSEAKSEQIAQELAIKFERSSESVTSFEESVVTDKSQVGPTKNEEDPYALIYIPALGEDAMGTPISPGVGFEELSQGFGQYPESEFPGEKGNFAIAGHRATHGEPLARFELLRAGDKVYVQTVSGWFTYSLIEDKKIANNEVWVLGNSPQGIGQNNGRLLTLTTCDPRWNSYQRWAWWGQLESVSTEIPFELEEIM